MLRERPPELARRDPPPLRLPLELLLPPLRPLARVLLPRRDPDDDDDDDDLRLPPLLPPLRLPPPDEPDEELLRFAMATLLRRV